MTLLVISGFNHEIASRIRNPNPWVRRTIAWKRNICNLIRFLPWKQNLYDFYIPCSCLWINQFTDPIYPAVHRFQTLNSVWNSWQPGIIPDFDHFLRPYSLPTCTFEETLSTEYAFHTNASPDSPFNNLHACFAKNAELHSHKDLNPIPPFDFGPHNLLQSSIWFHHHHLPPPITIHEYLHCVTQFL